MSIKNSDVICGCGEPRCTKGDCDLLISVLGLDGKIVDQIYIMANMAETRDVYNRLRYKTVKE